MNRRDFVKFMGVGSATIAASSALAKIPEAESKIILLNKPKEIILAKTIPDVDFIVKNVVSINYFNDQNEQVFESLGQAPMTLKMEKQSIEINVEYIDYDVNLLQYTSDQLVFSFDFDNVHNTRYSHLMSLNGRRFRLIRHNVVSNANNVMTAELTGREIL